MYTYVCVFECDAHTYEALASGSVNDSRTYYLNKNFSILLLKMIQYNGTYMC